MEDTKKIKKETQPSKRDQEAQPEQESVWEWVVAGIGALFVVLTLSYLLYDSFLTSVPPDIAVELTSVQPSGSRFLVQFQATNNGGEGASAVKIQGDLRDADGEVESADATIAYIAAGSSRAGGLYFSKDPRTLDLELFAVGYQEP